MVVEKNVFEMAIGELTGYSFQCECGNEHKVDLKEIKVSLDALDECVAFLEDGTRGKTMVVCDENTFGVAGSKIIDALGNCESHVIRERNGVHVAPNDTFVGEVLIQTPRDVDFFLAVGSGVVNDITRQVSYKMGKPYAVFATAPSMDGYASITSSLITNDIKQTVPGQCPVAIFADPRILRDAPFEMLTAGFGDVIGKYNAIRDWRFGRDYKNEHYCPVMAETVMNAVRKCEENAALLRTRDEQAVVNVMEALTLAGMAMGMYRNTRPASGAEHHIVHYWDVDCIARGVEHPLHGNSVGVGTVVICELYKLVEKELPVDVMEIDDAGIRRKLEEAGCLTSPLELNIGRDLFRESILKGHTMAAKFTVLTYLALERPELLEKTADQLVEKFYG
jgi:glycerol-1-phosphate dehydrogenase [NAD(P)+]